MKRRRNERQATSVCACKSNNFAARLYSCEIELSRVWVWVWFYLHFFFVSATAHYIFHRRSGIKMEREHPLFTVLDSAFIDSTKCKLWQNEMNTKKTRKLWKSALAVCACAFVCTFRESIRLFVLLHCSVARRRQMACSWPQPAHT